MAEVIIVGYQHYDFATSLVVGKIIYEDFSLNLDNFDGLIFTSKNAILSLQNNAKKYPQMQRWKQIPSYVIGVASARTLQTYGGNLAYISAYAHGEEFANELIGILSREKKYAYFRACEIVSNLDKKLQDEGFCIHSILSYKSIASDCKQDIPPKGSVLLFTSPSAYRFFLQRYPWDKSYRAIALGRSTFEAFDSGIEAEIAPIQEICKATLSLQERFKDY